MEKRRFTITAALPYTNGPVHIGHLAGVYIPADIFARYQRLRNNDVLFVCGSDEHGMAITMKARKEGVSPQQIVDKYHNIIKDSFEEFGISFDIYSRTSNKTHHETAQEFFLNLHEKGEFIEKTSQQYYDEQEKQFLADRYIQGTCPHCKNEEAYGDQCEKCGTSLSPEELIEPKSTISGAKPIKKETKHWYLPLDKYSDWLEEWIVEGHQDDWKVNVYGQCKSWIDQGLVPRAVTRDLDWGIKVPVENAEGKVLYVWFDAPIGYISASKEWATANNKNWEDYWKDNNTELIHFIGKDNIVFHCIIFPSMLKAHGDYVLPSNVPGMEFLNLEGKKISTSRDWAVWLHEYLQEFPGKQDSLRYMLTAIAPETKDNDFTWQDFQGKNNSELVGVFGNFVNRVLVLINKYWGGEIPHFENPSKRDLETLELSTQFKTKVEQSMERYRIREAQSEMMALARLGNKYLTEEEPWKHYKTDEQIAKNILYVSMQICAQLAILAEPFIPNTSEKLKNMLAFDNTTWEMAGEKDLLKSGHKINKASLLFERVEDATVEEQVQKLEAKAQKQQENNNQVTPQKEETTFDDFMKMDLRVGTILEAQKMKKTKKLLQLKVDTGIDQRTIISGIAEHYNAEEIIGKKVMVLVNLAPRKMRGVESEGMILLSEKEDGKLYFVEPNSEANNGDSIA
ncbi:MAG: methionine--tRNA ligase [Flavobacteriales bacterium]|nr:methionine--tRNA ligase [Flavobacteriales bacterium]